MTNKKKLKKKKTNKRSKLKTPEKKAKICFCIAPFGGWFDNYYEEIYSPAIKSVGLSPRRANDIYRPSNIVSDIWAYTKKAEVILADLTGKNSNVFYELGLAHAIAKPVILITETMDDIPFDLRALRVIVYDKNAPDWGNILKESIENALKEVISSPKEAVLPTFLTVSRKFATITSSEKKLIEIKQEIDLLKRELRSTDHRRKTETDIGPERARSLIKDYIKAGLPKSLIVERLVELGPPESWILREIGRIKKKI